jgi:hypothetical protein
MRQRLGFGKPNQSTIRLRQTMPIAPKTTRFTNVTKSVDVRISVDGQGRWTDIAFLDRPWHSLTYDCVY